MAKECDLSTSTCSEGLPVYHSKTLPCVSTDFNEPEASDELYDSKIILDLSVCAFSSLTVCFGKVDFACPNHLHWSFEDKQCSLLCPTDNNPDGYYLAMKIVSK